MAIRIAVAAAVFLAVYATQQAPAGAQGSQGTAAGQAAPPRSVARPATCSRARRISA